MKTLNAFWSSFQAATAPRNASQQEFREKKSNFYAGATAVMTIISSIDKNATNEEIKKVMDSLHDEIDSYTQQISKKIN